MCVAGLNVSTQPCEHRWYQLVRSCRPTSHLANCPSKLQLQGWEARVSTCPFCSSNPSEPVLETTHRLFGGNRSANTNLKRTAAPSSSTSRHSTSNTLSSSPPDTSSTLPPTTRTSPTGLSRASTVPSATNAPSMPTTAVASSPPSLSSLPALSRHSSISSTESERGQRHREMNERLAIYLTTHPHDVLPSARKNAPTYPLLVAGEDGETEGEGGFSGGGSGGGGGAIAGVTGLGKAGGSLIGLQLRKGVRISRNILGGVGGGGAESSG